MCDEEWSIYKNHCYIFKTMDAPIKWTRAEKICNMDGAHLVSIMDVNEMKFLHHMMVSDWMKGENGTYIGKVKCLLLLAKISLQLIVLFLTNVMLLSWNT